MTLGTYFQATQREVRMRRVGWGEIGNEDSFGEVECAPYSHLNWVKGWCFRRNIWKS